MTLFPLTRVFCRPQRCRRWLNSCLRGTCPGSCGRGPSRPFLRAIEPPAYALHSRAFPLGVAFPAPVRSSHALATHLARSGLLHTCCVPRASLLQFLGRNSQLHRLNSFHNLWHVTDVLHATHLLAQQLPAAAASRFPAEELLALYLAAVCHDVDHPGSSNGFLRASLDPLVEQHGCGSTLERHHAAQAVALVSGSGVLGGLTDTQRRRVQELLTRLILATDIELNGAFLEAFQLRCAGGAACDWAAEGDAREAMMCMLLKVADISNVCKPWPMALRWAGLLKVEHLVLLEKEKEAGLPATPVLALPMAELCAGFITAIAGPLVQALGSVIPWVNQAPLGYLTGNAASWRQAAQAAVKPAPPERPAIGETQLECVATRGVACA